MACPSSSPREPRVLEKPDLVRTWLTDSTYPGATMLSIHFTLEMTSASLPGCLAEVKGQPRLLPSLSLNEGG